MTFKLLFTIAAIFAVGMFGLTLDTKHDAQTVPYSPQHNESAIADRLSDSTYQPIKPCEYEDTSNSYNCVWVASDRGNLIGHSFYANTQGDIQYMSHDAARSLLKIRVENY